MTLEDLDIEVHLVKEGQIVSKDAKSQTKLIHGINLVLARNYSENLKEEVKKGMREKASREGIPAMLRLVIATTKPNELSRSTPSTHAWSSGSWSSMRLEGTRYRRFARC